MGKGKLVALGLRISAVSPSVSTSGVSPRLATFLFIMTEAVWFCDEIHSKQAGGEIVSK